MCWFQSLSFFRRTKPKINCTVQAEVTFKRDGQLANKTIKKMFIPHRANYSPRRCFWKKRFKIKFNWRSTRKVHGQWSTRTWSLWPWVSLWQSTIKGTVAHNDLQLILYTSDYIKFYLFSIFRFSLYKSKWRSQTLIKWTIWLKTMTQSLKVNSQFPKLPSFKMTFKIFLKRSSTPWCSSSISFGCFSAATATCTTCTDLENKCKPREKSEV